MEKIIHDIFELEKTDPIDYTGYYKDYDIFRETDSDGLTPEIFISSGNRTAGKTFFFKALLVRLFNTFGHQFMLLTRKMTQLGSVGRSFYSDLEDSPYFTDCKFSVDKSEIAGVKSINVNGEVMAYITYINYEDDLKEASNLFNRVAIILKDEFQSRDNKYCDNEVIKVRSIHKSVARRFGQHTRYVPLLLVGNHISVINPYYLSLGIYKIIQPNTKRLRGVGWVLHVTFNSEAARKGKKSRFEQAFGEDDFYRSNNENVYLDNKSMVEKCNTKDMRCIMSFVRMNNGKTYNYNLWQATNFFYVTRTNCRTRMTYALDIDSHNENTVLLRPGNLVFVSLKSYFDQGKMKFQDSDCKSVMVELFITTML